MTVPGAVLKEMVAVICEESDNTDDGDAIGLTGRGKTR